MTRLALLLACSSPEAEAPAEEAAPYLADEDALDLPEPSFDAEEASAAVAEALGLLREITATPILDAYEAAMEGADASCPSWFSSEDGVDYWYDDCAAADGTRFSGYGALVDYDGLESGGFAWEGRVVYGAGTITAPDGAALSLNGAAGLLEGRSAEGVAAAWNVVDGEFSAEGAGEGWLATGVEPELQMQAFALDEIRAFIADGTLAGLEGEIDAVRADALLLATEQTGAPCSLEPAGTLSLRGADGHWTDVVFDVPYDAATESFGAMEAADCDGCGTAWFQGQELGQACFDFSTLLDWESSPW